MSNDYIIKVHEAIIWLGKLGGYLARRNDGPPGPKTIWRGLTRLKDMVEIYSKIKK